MAALREGSGSKGRGKREGWVASGAAQWRISDGAMEAVDAEIKIYEDQEAEERKKRRKEEE